MRRRLFTYLIVPAALAVALAAPSGATAASPNLAGWNHFHWVPTDMGAGFQCGVPFETMHPTGYVDFWMGPIGANGVQRQIQHWNGSMTFTGPTGSTVTLRENDWRYVTRTYTSADESTYRETTSFVGLLEKLTASDGARGLVDAGALTTRTENTALAPGWYQITSLTILDRAGSLPMRRSGFDLDLQGWTKECAYFADHLK